MSKRYDLVLPLLFALLMIPSFFHFGCRKEMEEVKKEESSIVQKLLELSFDHAFNLLGPHSIHLRYIREAENEKENLTEEHTLIINSTEDYRQEILRNGKRVYEVIVKSDRIYKNVGREDRYSIMDKNLIFYFYWNKTWNFWKETLSPILEHIRYIEEEDGTIQDRWGKKVSLSLIPYEEKGKAGERKERMDEIGTKRRGKLKKTVPVYVTGYIWIDRETGAPLEMMIDGDFKKIFEKGRKRTELEKRYRFSFYQKIYNIGKQTEIGVPSEDKIIELKRAEKKDNEKKAVKRR